MKESTFIPEIETYSNLPAIWLAGCFEVGGGMGYYFTSRNGKKYAHPYIHLTDSNSNTPEFFKNKLEGNIRKNGNSWEWKVSGRRAAEIVVAFKDHVKSRTTIAESFENWLDAESAEDKVEVAVGFRALERDYTEIDDYKKLIEDPRFVAGIIETRGALYKNRKDRITGKTSIHMSFSSVNSSLLRALQSKFGGSYTDRASRVEEGIDSGYWDITNVYEINRLFDFIWLSMKYNNKKFELSSHI